VPNVWLWFGCNAAKTTLASPALPKINNVYYAQRRTFEALANESMHARWALQSRDRFAGRRAPQDGL
jgi:hypothetical protein